MEWVETTGRTVDEAKDAALDQLGVDTDEAEFELLEEPRSGLFGRTRGEARVRARVKPRQPRPKQERRDRRRSSGRRRGSGKGGQAKGGRSKGDKGADERQEKREDTKASSADDKPKEPAASGAGGGSGGGSRSSRRRRSRGGRGGGQPAQTTKSTGGSSSGKEQAMGEDVTVEEQADIMSGFLEGLLDAFGVEAEIERSTVDEETIELDVVGDDLGLLIGPKGRTLGAVQELSRTVVQRQATGTHHGRVRIDVGGYRQRRKEALQRFTRQVADDVRESGERKALEAMGAADRKIVHDTVNELEGVGTISEGEEPRRRVVIIPADD